MGEIFRRETAEHPEPFTGERLTTAVGGQVRIEHYHRYLFARSLVSELDVLDVASGEGYGSALLAQVARSVVGMEHSGSTVRSAVGNFTRSNLQFLQGDARAMPLADGCLDIVVSFETIEHFDRQNEFLREARRVLRPDGCIIVSTPDRDVYSPAGSPANPFHVHELSRLEFAALLRGAFRHVLMMQQRALIGSALLADTGSAAPPLVFDRRGEAHFEACAGLPRAPYLIAVASDRELPPLPPSLYIDRGDLDTEQLRLMALTGRLGEMETQLTRTTADLHDASQRAGVAEQARAESEQRNATLQDECESVQHKLDHAQQQLDHAQQQLDHTQQQLDQTQRQLDQTQRQLDQTQRQLDHVRGSLRTFMRGYLPRLRHHLWR